jgi:adenylate cyclase
VGDLSTFERLRERLASIRWSLIRNLGLLVLGIGAAMLASTFWFASRAVEDLSQAVLERTTDRTETELRRFFTPPRANLRIARDWGRRGLLTGATPRALNRLLIPMLEAYPQVSSLMIADDTGLEHLILRRGERWFVRIVRVDRWGRRSRQMLWSDAETLVSDQEKELDYDPRKRPWYRGAVGALRARRRASQGASQGVSGGATQGVSGGATQGVSGGASQGVSGGGSQGASQGVSGGGSQGASEGELPVHYTAPYTFFTTKDPGITLSTAYPIGDTGGAGEEGATDARRQVVAFDVLLTDISRFTTALAVSRRGKAFVLTDDGRTVGLPRDARFSDEGGLAAIKAHVLRPPAKLGIPAVAAATRHWRRRGKPTTPFAFELRGEQWWAGFHRYALGPDRALWIAVTVPEGDFAAGVKRQRNLILGITGGALAVALLLALWLARRYSRPLERLARQSRRIRDLDLTPGSPVGARHTELQRLARDQEQMRAALESFGRYVPLEVVRQLVRRGEVARIGGRTATLTLLFSDIRGFTTISEALSPAELAEHMADYFAALLEVLQGEEATVDKFIGDAILAFWGAPNPDPEAPHRAVRAALGCTARLADKNRTWQAAHRPPLPTCFGIHTGEVVVGNFGAPTRLSYTALGDAVNLASRLEGLNRLYGTEVLVSNTVAEAVGDAFHLRRVDLVAVKGKREAVQILEVLGPRGEVPAERLAFARAYEEAFDRYQDRDFDGALERLEALRAEPGPGADDASVHRLREAARAMRDQSPGADWDGVARLDKK